MKNNFKVIIPGFLGRREFLKTGSTFLTAISAPSALAAATFPQHMREPGSMDEPYGQPSKYERRTTRSSRGRSPAKISSSSYTPIDQQKGIITPSGLHYTIHHSGIPDITPNDHKLYIHGMTDRNLKLSICDLKRYPITGNFNFLECDGNSWAQGRMPNAVDMNCQELHGLVSGSEWLGVPVKLLLQEAGVKAKGKWVIAEGADSSTHARSIPIEKMMSDAIIALYQNGERLRPAQGYPMRLFLPGWEGNTSVKWLRRLEIVDVLAYTKDESRAYTETLPDGSIEGFSLRMGVKSIITHPSAGQQLPDKGFYEIQGLAWSGLGKIRKVEVSDNGGNTWHPAELQGPALAKALTRFSLPWKWSGQSARILSRATDEQGIIQPTHLEWKKRYYKGSYKHYNAIQTWYISESGAVKNVY